MNYTPGSQAELDAKNAKKWSAIVAGIALLVHILALTHVIASHPLEYAKAHQWLYIGPFLFIAYFAAVIISFLKDAWWITQSNAGWIVMIVLFAFSIFCIAYCPAC